MKYDLEDIKKFKEIERELKIWEKLFEASSKYLKPSEYKYSYNFMKYQEYLSKYLNFKSQNNEVDENVK
ncbi:hypothetical protein SAMN04244560_02655 [Thermoanaerobacter thermohydrosulfuricus]|uniref:Uncharacterized protein n=1 Tax=Thermoanaerobacter thermohydrosulfuricus TaxID=1516 RepID=A0A1G7VQJ1_THETY|nr:hypothetical protein [Thermoanaerobacter thermohydrosulfuricus]SDG62075.1 hypothetical protein SAMN04244560_02655 [Thermoanaerobacter thermohydrosulfuricus]